MALNFLSRRFFSSQLNHHNERVANIRGRTSEELRLIAIAREIGGIRFVGIQKGYDVRPDMVLFMPLDPPATLAVPVRSFNSMYVNAKVADAKRRYGVKDKREISTDRKRACVASRAIAISAG